MSRSMPSSCSSGSCLKAARPCSRRWLVTRLPLALVGAPLIAEAQRTAPVYRVGYLGGSREAAPLVDVLRGALRDLGYIEGRNIVFTIHWDEPDRERLRDVATELLRSQVDVIVAGPDPAIAAATRASKTIPIVMVLPTDPVGSGFITSLARPGGNVTGLTLDAGPEIHGKRFEFLKAAFPHISHVAVLRNPTSVASGTYAKVLDAAAVALKVALVRIDVRDPAAFEAARRTLARHPPQALLVEPDPLVYSHRTQVVELVAKLRVPTVYGAIDWVNIGGLMAYAANRAHLMQRAASYVDRIIKGAKPADLPVEQPTMFEFVINMRTAKAVGLTIPRAVLARADHIVE